MAAVAKSGTPSLSTPNPADNCRIGPLTAGEAIAAGDACYIKSDGKAWLATGAADNAAAKVAGFAMEAVPVGAKVTLYHDVNVRYGAGLTPGARVFLSGATAGALADAASTGGLTPCGVVVDATRIRVLMTP